MTCKFQVVWFFLEQSIVACAGRKLVRKLVAF